MKCVRCTKAIVFDERIGGCRHEDDRVDWDHKATLGNVPTFEGDPRMLTADGVKITDGGRLWNYYDCKWVTVEFGDSMSLSPTGEYWDGWFTVVDEDGNRSTLNGERMASKPRKR